MQLAQLPAAVPSTGSSRPRLTPRTCNPPAPTWSGSLLQLRGGPSQQLQRVVCQGAPAPEYAYPSAPELPTQQPPVREVLSEPAQRALSRATSAVRQFGWVSFWFQLTLSVVSAVILLFSVAFTPQSGPRASLYLTLVGILAGFLSTFWNFGYTRTALKMQQYLMSPHEGLKIKKQQVMDLLTKGVLINMLGLGSTLLGVSALVGMLVAKTLTNASANPFLASAAGSYNPVLALDVFLVQAATNTLLGHFVSLCCSLWLLHVVGEGKGLRFQATKESSISAGYGPGPSPATRANVGTYRVTSTPYQQ